MQPEEKGYKGPCPECGSSDAKHFYPDGQTHCFSCNHHTFSDGRESFSYEVWKEGLGNMSTAPLKDNVN